MTNNPPIIADVFHRAGLIEKWGRGTNRVIAMCKKHGAPPPLFEERQGFLIVTGLELVEMNRSKENAFCCGGGGGNFSTDLLGSGPESPARSRVREAAETGAAILAVACPNCAKMLEDAVKAENLEEKIAVKDIAEIIQGGQI